MKAVYLVSCIFAIVSATPKRFDDYQVIQINVESREDKVFVRGLQLDEELDIWSEGLRSVDIMVPPHRLTQLQHDLNHQGLTWKTVIPDVQQKIDAVPLEQGPREMYNYSDFNSYEDTQRELRVLASACATHPVYPDLICEVDTLVLSSYAGRTLQVLRVSRPQSDRKIVYLDALIHAREWLAGTTIMNVAHDIVHGTTQQGIDELGKYDFFFNPVVNPDGYAYTWTGNRLWRKNTAPTINENCTGVDLNRNFDYDWGVTPGSDGNPCGETYRGESAASEPETRAVQLDMDLYADRILTYISIHCYSQLWLSAYGALVSEDPEECKYPEAYDDCQYTVAQFAAMASGNTYGNYWQGGSTCSTIYPATGITPDYATGAARITFGYTPELRGEDNDGVYYGFSAPASEIPYAYAETWDGILGVIVKIEGQLSTGSCQI